MVALGAGARNQRQRDFALAALLSVNFGVAFLSRNALGLAAPFIERDISLSNAQLGGLSGALACAWAISGIVTTRALGGRFSAVALLIGLCVVDALSLVWAAAASAFWGLVAARVLTGAAGGPVLPVTQALIAHRGGSGKRGLRMGATQAFGGSLIGGILAPWLVISLAQSGGWRFAFGGVAVCCLLAAGLLWLAPREAAELESDRQREVIGPLGSLQVAGHEPSGGRGMAAAEGPIESAGPVEVKEPTGSGAWGSDGRRQASGTPLESGRSQAVAGGQGEPGVQRRNVWLCCCLSVLMVGWLLVMLTFVPTVLMRARGWSGAGTSFAMSAMGLVSMLSSVVVPGLSDVLGRRSALVAATLVGALATAGVGVVSGGGALDVAILGLTGIAGGTFPLFMGIIPAESVRPGMAAGAIAWVQGAGELIGGLLGPLLAGFAADRLGVLNVIWIAAGCAGAAALVGLFVVETRPDRART